jgi:hypothetical protein
MPRETKKKEVADDLTIAARTSICPVMMHHVLRPSAAPQSTHPGFFNSTLLVR